MRLWTLLLFSWSIAYGACSGSSPTWTAASASLADVTACYTAASNGDTINVPAGTSTWTGSLTISKDLILVGAGVGSTNLSRSGTECFFISMAHTIRITGFTFNNCIITAAGDDVISGKTFRIDHNSFTAPSWTINNMHGGCTTPQLHPTGLWDHNTFFNFAVHTGGSLCTRVDGNYQDQLWAQVPPLGSGTGVVYVEDNSFDGDNTINIMDGNYAAQTVARFNTLTGGAGYLEMHSVQGNNRAYHSWEIYKNTITSTPGSFFGLAFIRGGTGVVWGNRVPTGLPTMKLNNVRSNTGCVAAGTCATSGVCDGTSLWDQNTTGQTGYACRDEIGRGYDAVLWITNAAYTQVLMPAYFWDNLDGSSSQYAPTLHDGETGTSYLSIQVVQNRDWYIQNTSFDGTSGVGVGVLASRPGTCTAGVTYWATDQGSWNQSGGGGQGLLYKCTSTNTWSLYYTPYTYPHPLQGTQPSGSSLSGPATVKGPVMFK